MQRSRKARKVSYSMAGKPQTKKTNRPSKAQVFSVVLSVVIILSFVLSLFINK